MMLFCFLYRTLLTAIYKKQIPRGLYNQRNVFIFYLTELMFSQSAIEHILEMVECEIALPANHTISFALK